MSSLPRPASAVSGLTPPEVPDAWVKAWREGFLPQLSDADLRALAEGLRTDDPALLQDQTTNPPPLTVNENTPCKGGCALSYAAWKGRGLATVGEVEEAFGALVAGCIRQAGNDLAHRLFLNWFDQTPRETMRQLLLAEVQEALRQRMLTVALRISKDKVRYGPMGSCEYKPGYIRPW